MKIGRNELCPCGSGKKYKKCCIDTPTAQSHSALQSAPPEVVLQIQEILRLRKAEENVRRQQQGHGKPIISTIAQGYRIVAVRNTVHWNKDWIVFTDFLLYFLKKTLGETWGEREKSKGLHPVFRWLGKMQRHSMSQPTQGKLKSSQMIGFIACWLHLAYALYLIAHHDEIPNSLLKRLRDVRSFMPAYYEVIVGAVLAVAGFELSSAETKATSVPTPEFRAKSKTTGTVYEVEAKRKERWKTPTNDVSNPDFLRELEGYLRDQVHRASKKKLKNPVFWFELSIPTLRKEADWRAVAAKVRNVLRDAEKELTVGGERVQPAFVAITNHTFLVDEEIRGEPSFAILETLNIDDYPFGRPVEIEEALSGYDKYRDIFWMMKAWKIARTVPTTFEGTPPELLSRDGAPQRTIRIGDIVEVPDHAGNNVKAKVTNISSMDGMAMLVVTANGRTWLSQMPLSEGEAAAAKRFTDAVFGNDNPSRQVSEEDPFELYDFVLQAYENMTQDQVDKFFDENPTLSHFKRLPLKDARVRIAREHTKWMWDGNEQSKQGSSPADLGET